MQSILQDAVSTRRVRRNINIYRRKLLSVGIECAAKAAEAAGTMQFCEWKLFQRAFKN